jgi:hypothetical protein
MYQPQPQAKDNITSLSFPVLQESASYIMTPCMCSALCCSYTAIDCDNISLICKDKKGEICCCVMERCLDVNGESLGVRFTNNKDNRECCKISLYTAVAVSRPPINAVPVLDVVSISRLLLPSHLMTSIWRTVSVPFMVFSVSQVVDVLESLEKNSSKHTHISNISSFSIISKKCPGMRLLRPCRNRVPSFGPSSQGLRGRFRCGQNRTLSL